MNGKTAWQYIPQSREALESPGVCLLLRETAIWIKRNYSRLLSWERSQISDGPFPAGFEVKSTRRISICQCVKPKERIVSISLQSTVVRTKEKRAEQAFIGAIYTNAGKHCPGSIRNNVQLSPVLDIKINLVWCIKDIQKNNVRLPKRKRLAQEIAFGPVVFRSIAPDVEIRNFPPLSGKRKSIRCKKSAGRPDWHAMRHKYYWKYRWPSKPSCWKKTVGVTGLRQAGFCWTMCLARVNMEFNHDVNYQGLFHLEEALLNGRPKRWKYSENAHHLRSCLSQLPEQVQKKLVSRLLIISIRPVSPAKRWKSCSAITRNACSILAGIPGRWATQCVQYNIRKVEVTIVDLPQQLEMMRKANGRFVR